MSLEELLPFSLLVVPIAIGLYAHYRDYKLHQEIVEIIRTRGEIKEENYLSK